MSAGQANTCHRLRFLDFFLIFLLRIHQDRVKKKPKKRDTKNLSSWHFVCEIDPQTGFFLFKDKLPPPPNYRGGAGFFFEGRTIKMDKELEKKLMKAMRPPKPWRRMYIGNRGGRPVYLPVEPNGFKKLCEKYPGGVIPEWKAVLLRIFKPRWKNSPWFSDVLDGVCKKILGE